MRVEIYPDKHGAIWPRPHSGPNPSHLYSGAKLVASVEPSKEPRNLGTLEPWKITC